MTVRTEIEFLSNVIDLMAEPETAEEVDKLANYLIKAVNHIRNSEIYSKEGSADHFKSVQIQNV